MVLHCCIHIILKCTRAFYSNEKSMHVMTRHLLDIVNGMLKCVCIIQVPHMHAQCE